ncbi:MAG: lytic transglycosylase domain-containing protein [Zoogloeaceae bacterium]|jgi:soluble lytic murein transglycosylase|nr:lytic transglycosylase domain-containing protein [Zoogloeaceae bacterium]
MKSFFRFFVCAGIAALLSPFVCAQAQEDAVDHLFLEAREAFRAGNRAALEALADPLSGHVLAPWVNYYRLRQGLEKRDETTVLAFIERENGSYLSGRLRADWLAVLAKRANWRRLSEHYQQLAAPDQDARCLFLLARVALKENAARRQAEALWTTLPETPEGCQALFARLGVEVSDDLYWQRARLLVEQGKMEAVRRVLQFLPNAQQPDKKQFEQISKQPALWLARLKAEDFKRGRSWREIAALAIARLAQSDPLAARSRLDAWQTHLGPQAAAWCWGQIALSGARRHMPEALSWFSRSSPDVRSKDVAEWHVRAALRARNWYAVLASVRVLPKELQEQPAWIYWQARAHKEVGHFALAHEQFQQLRGQANFYGNLADEELKQPIRIPPPAEPPSDAEMRAARAHPGLLRALALLRLDLRIEGVREWNWVIRDMDDRQLLAAAHFAYERQAYDRAINTAERTREQHDYSLRFLAPFASQVRSAAQEQALDDAWVYGLMRQESRFIVQAKSSAGASGLMQLMPATAKWVARKIGLKDYDHKRVNDTEINLLLGTAYMRMVLESLHQHPVLASAAYNAGPSRARAWSANTPLEGAIYAETIPFTETRDYVKKVMSNAVYYSILFTGKPASLRERLGEVPARGG